MLRIATIETELFAVRIENMASAGKRKHPEEDSEAKQDTKKIAANGADVSVSRASVPTFHKLFLSG